MRLARSTVSVIGLAFAAVALTATGAEAKKPQCPPKKPGNPYPPGLCNLRVSASSIAPSESLDVAGSGFRPGSSVTVTVGTAPAGTAIVDGDGQFSQALTVPASLGAGKYDVKASGLAEDGGPLEQKAFVQVLAAAGSPAAVRSLQPGAGLAAGGAPVAKGGAAAAQTGTAISTSLASAEGAASSQGLNPLVGLGGGLALTAAGAATVVVARRRRAAKD